MELTVDARPTPQWPARAAPQRVLFCTRCHRIAGGSGSSACCWCGSGDVVQFSFREISANFRTQIGDWIDVGIEGAN